MIKCFGSINCSFVNENGWDFKLPTGKNDFMCLLLENPSQEEITKVCRELKFQERHFISYKKEARSARYSMNPLVFVFIDYYLEGRKIIKTNLLFLMKKNVLVVVTPQKSQYYRELFRSLASRLKGEKIEKNQVAYFLYYFLYEDTRENYDVLDEIENRVMAIEESVRKLTIDNKLINNVVSLKRSCFRMSKLLWASAKLIFTIKKGLTPLTLNKELLSLLDDVYDTLVHQTEMLTVQREILTDLLEIYATVINNNLTVISNELSVVMKKLTAFTVLIMVPTLITSFYGMNFKNMPELQSPYGYIIAIILMAFCAGLLYCYFHRRKWI